MSRRARQVVVPFSWGDLHLFLQVVVFAARHPRARAFHTWWWGYRETRRRGEWRLFTLGDQLHLIRMRRYLRHYPRRTARPGEWRHSPADKTR